jgi:DNA repair protein RecN (Recombination protein N)
VGQVFQEVSRRAAELDALVARRDDVRRRADYLRHVADEIAQAQLQPGEDDRLEVEARRLVHAEELSALAESIANAADGDDHDARSALAKAIKALAQLERLDPDTGVWRSWLDAAYANLDELAAAARAYATDIEQDPNRLGVVESRRGVIHHLQQKYGPTLGDVLTTGHEAIRELELLDTADHDLAKLTAELASQRVELVAAAAALSAARDRGAERLAEEVDRLLTPLGMPEGNLRVALDAEPEIRAHGAERVSFDVRLNPGLPARPLARVASGGELSRIMLALKVVLARHDRLPTLVFDEVDQGIGGQVGAQVGDALARVASGRQVLVITHLPQIAARAARHLAVAKRARGGVATSDVQALEGGARVTELARMLGDADAETARRHARELLKVGSVAAPVPGG